MIKTNWTKVFYLFGDPYKAGFNVRLENLLTNFLVACPGLDSVLVSLYSLPEMFLVGQHAIGELDIEDIVSPEPPRGIEILLAEEMKHDKYYATLTIPVCISGVCALIRFYSPHRNFFDNYIYLREINQLVKNLALILDVFTNRKNLETQNNEFIHSLAQAIDARDPYTQQHSVRVARYAVLLGLDYGLSRKELEIIRRGALLHDIGKLALPDWVLFKDGPLNEEERRLIKKHPEVGANIVSSRTLQELVPIVLYHHEKYDGSGYPRGLKQVEISFAAQIVGITDVYEALTADRIYRPAFSQTEARRMMEKEMPGHFNGKILHKFLNLLDRLSKKKTGNIQDLSVAGKTSVELMNYFHLNPYAVSSPDDLARIMQIDINLIERELNNMVLNGYLCSSRAYDAVYYYLDDISAQGAANKKHGPVADTQDGAEVMPKYYCGGIWGIDPLTGLGDKKELMHLLTESVLAGRHFSLIIIRVQGLTEMTKAYSETVIRSMWRDLVTGIRGFLSGDSKIFYPEKDLLALITSKLNGEQVNREVCKILDNLGLDLQIVVVQNRCPEDGESALELYYHGNKFGG